MSADNGIYILKTKDGQYRVTHAQAIERIYEYCNPNRYDPLEVVLVWSRERCTKDYEKAMKIAEIMNKHKYTEYGIRIFTFNKTWKHIVEDAKWIAKEKLKQENNSKWEISMLEYIVNL